MHGGGLPEVKRPLAAKPLEGMRLLLLLDRDKRRYGGTARTPDETWEMTVSLEGEVSVETNAPQDVADYARRVVRIAMRDAAASRTAPPLKIHRWRAAKE